MADSNYSPAFLAWAAEVRTSKRAQKALEFLLDKGSVTTGDLQAVGYDHPPRAIRDLKDAGFTIESMMVNVDGKRMSQYTLIDSMSADFAQRKPIPLAFRKQLFEEHGYRCAVCGGVFITRMLQADHRIPFHVGGDPDIFETMDFMPLCGSDNRGKSMSCETCANWEVRDPSTCKTCYWHDPTNYKHVATAEERRLAITARGDDVPVIDALMSEAASSGKSAAELALQRLRDADR
ncbi:HNH endonuclease [Streptomyces sp. NPDC058872]|uniref:HNH endonuclease n=1 Tax=Streptomyces sp. NPDC058872 TaxID=3346661 RepID=UPI00367860EA